MARMTAIRFIANLLPPEVFCAESVLTCPESDVLLTESVFSCPVDDPLVCC